MNKLPAISIIGRPNVGKSTLFNRLVKKRVAIVDLEAGTTRDRIEKVVEYNTKKFVVIDTGGMDVDKMQNAKCKMQNHLSNVIHKQIKIAIEHSDLLLFVVDGNDGLTPIDEEIAKIIYKSNKETILVINKIDNVKQEANAYEFYKLNFDKINIISALHNRRCDELIDRITELLPKVETDEPQPIKIAVVGKPNVGKSTLINSILGEERLIIDEKPYTTRDAIDIYTKKNGKEYLFIDTAGLRKKKKVNKRIEYYSVKRALAAIKRSDIAILLIDTIYGVVAQDKKIAAFISENNKPTLIIVNKYDLVKDTKKLRKDYIKAIRKELHFIDYAPILFVSALKKYGIDNIFDITDRILKEYQKSIPQDELNNVIEELKANNPPPYPIRIYYGTQVRTSPPTFDIFLNKPDKLHFSYKRYIENRLRNAFVFEGSPIIIDYKSKKGNYSK